MVPLVGTGVLMGCSGIGLVLDIGGRGVTGSSGGGSVCGHGRQRGVLRKGRAKELLNCDLLHHCVRALVGKKNKSVSWVEIYTKLIKKKIINSYSDLFWLTLLF